MLAELIPTPQVGWGKSPDNTRPGPTSDHHSEGFIWPVLHWQGHTMCLGPVARWELFTVTPHSSRPQVRLDINLRCSLLSFGEMTLGVYEYMWHYQFLTKCETKMITYCIVTNMPADGLPLLGAKIYQTQYCTSFIQCFIHYQHWSGNIIQNGQCYLTNHFGNGRIKISSLHYDST